MKTEPMTDRRPEDLEAYPYSELDMDMHVEAVTKDLRDEIERLRAALQYIADSEHWGAGVLVATAKQALTGRLGD